MSRMKIVMRASAPLEIECSLEMTMSLDDWLRFSEQLSCQSGWPAWEIRSHILQVIARARKTYEATDMVPDELGPQKSE